MNDFSTDKHPDQVKCRNCGENRVKTFHSVSSNKRTIWVNEFGQRWYGKKCPQCYDLYKKEYDAKLRLENGNRPLGSTDYCEDCSKPFLVRKGSTKKCNDCKGIALSEAKLTRLDHEEKSFEK